MRVYVLLFNARTENEGIHTLQTVDPERGERNLVLMFETQEDAERYGMLLEAQDFPEAAVEEIDDDEVREFCESAGYDCKLVRSDDFKWLIPPETNVDESEMEWNTEGKPQKATTSNAAPPDEGTMSPDELDRIRRQLEGLL